MFFTRTLFSIFILGTFNIIFTLKVAVINAVVKYISFITELPYFHVLL